MKTLDRARTAVGRFSLRLVLVAPFVMLVSTAVALTGYLSFRSGRMAVRNMTDQLQSEIGCRIEADLHHFFSVPREINQINRDAVSQGLLNIDDLSSWQRHLWHQSSIFESISRIAAGNEKGEYIGIDKRDNGQVVGRLCDATTGFALMSIEAGAMGAPASPGQSADSYDPRNRSWYRSTVESGQPRWSSLYEHFVDPTLQIALSFPLFDESGGLKGVTTAAIRLSRITSYLQRLKIGRTGLAFIVDSSGLLIASSTDEPGFYVLPDGKVQRTRADESIIPLIRHSTLSVLQQVGEWRTVDGAFTLNDFHNGEPLFERVIPFKNPFGLDWRIVVVVPEADFMSSIHENVGTTVVLCLLALCGSLAVGFLTVRWVAGPILLMNAASIDLVEGREVRGLPTDRGDEIGSLARSFHRIAREMKHSLENLNSELAERQRVEVALRRTEAEYRSVFENAIEGIFRSTLDGRFLSVSPSFARMYGYDSPDELIESIRDIGKDIYVHREDRDRFLEQLIRSDVVTGFEQEIRRKDGSTGWVSVSARSVRNDRGELVYLDGFTIDITERKWTEDALKMARVVVESSPVVLFRWKAAAGWPVDMVSGNVSQFGYTPEELRSGEVTFASMVHPDDLDRVAREVQEHSIAGMERFQQEYRIIARDGGVRWMDDRTLVERDSHGQIMFYQGIVIDITERKQAEDALRESMRRLQTVVNGAPVVLYSFDRHGVFTLSEGRGLVGLGVKPGEIVGCTIFEIYGDQPEAIAALRRAMAGETFTLELAFPAGGTFEASHIAMRDETGDYAGTIGVLVDITERKLAEEALRTSLEEKESLLKEVHHRVKNNLQVISSLLNLQARQVRNPELHGFLRETRNRVSSMALLHETLYRSGNLARVNLAQYVKNVCSNLVRSYASVAGNIRLLHEVADVTLDQDLAIPTGLIITELVSNAFKHAFPSRSEGEILVKLHTTPEQHLLLRVSDNGIGLPADLDPQNAETLGLLLVRNLTRQLDGRLSISVGQGTVFEIVFPAHSPLRGASNETDPYPDR